MPLPPPTAERTRIHARNVQLCGFKRTDGHWDIEARLTDTKDHDYLLSSGLRQQGDAVHDMWVRVTINGQMGIVDAAACIDEMPYAGYCERITPDYSKLIGLNLFDGFRRAVKELFAGTRGCSHLSEMLMYLPTVALQTFASEVPDNADSEHKPYQFDKCHALDLHSDVVQRYYPRWYRGQKTG